MISRKQIRNIVGIGFSVAGVALLLGVMFPPLLLVTFVTAVATGFVVSILYGRASGRWALARGMLIATVVWGVASTYAWYAWGIAFDMADAHLAVPVELNVSFLIAAVVSLATFIGLIAMVPMAIIRANRLPERPVAPSISLV